MLFPVLYLGAKFYYKVPYVKAKDMDFVTNIAEIEAETYVYRHFSYGIDPDYPYSYDEPVPRNKAEAFWQWLVSCFSSLFVDVD